MADIEPILKDMEAGKDVRFSDLLKVCEHFFGSPRNPGSSHYIFKMPWPGDPRVNIQNDKGRAKPYQVRQVLKAIARVAEPKSTPAPEEVTPMTGALAKRKPAKKR